MRRNTRGHVCRESGKSLVLEPPVDLGQDGQRVLLGYRIYVRPQQLGQLEPLPPLIHGSVQQVGRGHHHPAVKGGELGRDQRAELTKGDRASLGVLATRFPLLG